MLWSLAVLKACNPDVWCAGTPSRCTRPGAIVACLEAGARSGYSAWHRRMSGERIVRCNGSGWLLVFVARGQRMREGLHASSAEGRR